MTFKKQNNIIGWIVFAIATFTYVSTIEPTASFWDCGEYIACAFKLEVGHPPGAPFFLLVGRFFALLAGGDPAMAGKMINIMSALCSSFSILFLFWTITRLAFKSIVKKGQEFTQAKQWAVLGAGTVGALAYTFSDSFWFSAVEGEVYAMSSFFTAFVFWAILKWDEEDDTNPIGAMRWLVVIAYLMGLSIGVHLLNLLVIPAICFVYYFKKYPFTWKSFFITGIISLVILGGIQNIMIPKIVKFAADFEILFVNKFHMGFNTGSIIYFLLLFFSLTMLIVYTVNKKEKFYKIGFYLAILFTVIVAVAGASISVSSLLLRSIVLGGLLYGINVLKTKNTNTLNVVLVSFATLLIGYSSFFVLIIRSQANTPMDENDPENAITMLSYLNREQYGDWPLTYGQYYNAPTDNANFKDGEPVYAKDEKNNKYKIVDDRKKSIPAYNKDYCTPFPRMWSQQGNHVQAYRYWGDVQAHHRSKMNPQSGEMDEIPTFMANLTYFVNYQVKYMYLRYFAWNFIGRQNDIQGLTGNPLEGNWKTGITAFDDARLGANTSSDIHATSNNKASNSFYALPFILGILGFIFLYQSEKKNLWIVSLFFLLNGLAVVIYLNQYPYQPRERDYAYVASFYAFAIWIGFGVLFIFDLLSKKTNAKNAVVIATIIGLIIPTLMAAEGWDDHNRSKRSMSRDFAVNYLNSCAPNAILFTNGDNDTFPLWYAQEVEGIRTDVRVVNLSLLQTDWYIAQARRAAYESAPVPFTIPAEKLVQGTREVVYLMDKQKSPMNLKKAIEFVESDDIANKLDYGGGKPYDYLPTKSFYIPVDSMQVMREKVINVRDTARLAKNIRWDINRQYVTKNDLMVLDLIAHNNWKRPIYFAVTTGAEAYLGLEEYFQLEGLAYRLTPIKATENEMAQGGRVKTDVMYDNLVNKFEWGGLDKEGVSLDENCTRMASNMRMQMATLAGALINKGQKQKAEKVLDLCLEKMPDENVRYEATLYTVVAGYYQIGNMKKAMALSDKLFDVYENDYKVYAKLPPNHRNAFSREQDQAKEIMRRLVMLAEQFKQSDYSKKLTTRLTTTVPMNELMPPEQMPQ